ncbi:hypothetical protein [Lentzea jiangxiensis]|uniref:Secreted protein n=1 Tax=Lentzea jiangxiensis TaxID=641025 RepID=A0A1H0X6U4_9PSEU|nr:hypothetical protein [Lentzea jiangxiensis]SDP98176.1 hypothetical protein SAMN05421507_13619 [Lentzea jiangxiensis]
MKATRSLAVGLAVLGCAVVAPGTGVADQSAGTSSSITVTVSCSDFPAPIGYSYEKREEETPGVYAYYMYYKNCERIPMRSQKIKIDLRNAPDQHPCVAPGQTIFGGKTTGFVAVRSMTYEGRC